MRDVKRQGERACLPLGDEEDGLELELTLNGEVLDGQVLLPVVRQALVEGGVLLLGDLLRVARPDGLRLVELLVGLLNLLDLLLLLVLLLLLLIDLLDLGLLLVLLRLLLIILDLLQRPVSDRRRASKNELRTFSTSFVTTSWIG